MSEDGRESLIERAMVLFDELCELPPDAQRDALAERCAGDKRLRDRVSKMLEHDATGAGLLTRVGGQGASMLAETIGASDNLPAHVGRYRVIGEVGRGGMGVVYEAEQDQPRRRVALKVIRQGFLNHELRARFEREAQVLGRLDHSGIAQIFEAGTARIGNADLPFFAMEFIEGRPLDEHVREHRLEPRGILELVARVCDALQHAHQRGVIHRDLKPGNILVKRNASTLDGSVDSTVVDAIGQPKILDFGVARSVDADAQQVTLQTTPGQLVGTLAYMSPEQIDGRSADLDTRCDVYAIGVMLHTLLAGSPPLDLSGRSIAEAARIVGESDPRPLGAVVPSLRGDVETIVAKAIEKERDRRYGSAAELGEDIRRYLRSEPVMAHPPSTLYQARKFARRNKTLVGGIAATFAALIAGLVVAGALLVRVAEQRDAARLATEQAESVSQFQRRLIMSLDVDDVGRDIKSSLNEELARLETRGEVSAASVAAIEALDAINPTNLARAVLSRSIVESGLALADADYSYDPAVEAEIRLGIGDVLNELGRYDEAVSQLRRAVERNHASRGAGDSRTIWTELTLANSLIRLERFEAAVTLIENDLLERCERLRGPNDYYTVRAATRLGEAYRGLGRLEDAERMQLRALAGARASSDTWIVAPCLNELGVLAIDAGDYERALAYFDEFFEIEVIDEDAVSAVGVINATNNIMAALFKSGRLEDAERYARNVVPLYAAEYGDEHPQTIASRNNLARVLLDLGQYQEAAALLEPDYELVTQTLRATSNIRQSLATNYIDALLETGRASAAEVVARALLADRRAADAPNAGRLAQTLEQLGVCQLTQEKWEEAEMSFAKCVELRESIDTDHWLTHRARSYLGMALAGQGRFEDAEEFVVKGAKGIERQQAAISANMREREINAAQSRVRSFEAAKNR